MVGSAGVKLPKGITPAGSGDAGQAKNVEWSILGQTYWPQAESEDCFIFQTLDPPGDVNATSDYRCRVAEVVVARALVQAGER